MKLRYGIKDLKIREMQEVKGNLPYVVIWIGAHNLPSLTHHSILEEAIKLFLWLKSLKCRPSLLRGLEIEGKLIEIKRGNKK